MISNRQFLRCFGTIAASRPTTRKIPNRHKQLLQNTSISLKTNVLRNSLPENFLTLLRIRHTRCAPPDETRCAPDFSPRFSLSSRARRGQISRADEGPLLAVGLTGGRSFNSAKKSAHSASLSAAFPPSLSPRFTCHPDRGANESSAPTRDPSLPSAVRRPPLQIQRRRAHSDAPSNASRQGGVSTPPKSLRTALPFRRPSRRAFRLDSRCHPAPASANAGRREAYR
jgi:hypothetical protein